MYTSHVHFRGFYGLGKIIGYKLYLHYSASHLKLLDNHTDRKTGCHFIKTYHSLINF